MVDASCVRQVVCIVVDWCNGVNLVTFLLKGTNKVHPEIIYIPRRVQDNGNSHWALVEIIEFSVKPSNSWVTGKNPSINSCKNIKKLSVLKLMWELKSYYSYLGNICTEILK
jgi:hypothetical protein